MASKRQPASVNSWCHHGIRLNVGLHMKDAALLVMVYLSIWAPAGCLALFIVAIKMSAVMQLHSFMSIYFSPLAPACPAHLARCVDVAGVVADLQGAQHHSQDGGEECGCQMALQQQCWSE